MLGQVCGKYCCGCNEITKMFWAQMNFLIYSKIFLSDGKQIILITIMKSVPYNFE